MDLDDLITKRSKLLDAIAQLKRESPNSNDLKFLEFELDEVLEDIQFARGEHVEVE